MLLHDWRGILDIAAITKVTLVLHVQNVPEGLSATLDALEQNISELPIDSIAFDGSTLKFELKNFFGKL